jgi:hypothetical protein
MSDMYLKDIREVAERRLAHQGPTFQAATVLQLADRLIELESARAKIIEDARQSRAAGMPAFASGLEMAARRLGGDRG